jgi:hypothetical protein
VCACALRSSSADGPRGWRLSPSSLAPSVPTPPEFTILVTDQACTPGGGCVYKYTIDPKYIGKHPFPETPFTDHPDGLCIDLDPQPGTAFREATAIALDVRKPLLEELGLVGYPKTSGGRDLGRTAKCWETPDM